MIPRPNISSFFVVVVVIILLVLVSIVLESVLDDVMIGVEDLVVVGPPIAFLKLNREDIFNLEKIK